MCINEKVFKSTCQGDTFHNQSSISHSSHNKESAFQTPFVKKEYKNGVSNGLSFSHKIWNSVIESWDGQFSWIKLEVVILSEKIDKTMHIFSHVWKFFLMSHSKFRTWLLSVV